MDLSNFKEYYVAKARKSMNETLYIYGSHKDVADALLDQLNRSYKYNQETKLYGITKNNEVIDMNRVTA